MATFNDIVKKAYDYYGTSLGIKSVQLPIQQGTNNFHYIGDFHFFLKDEPLALNKPGVQYKNRMDGKAPHCNPFRDRFYCYTNGKSYDTLDDWYMDVGTPLYGEVLPPLTDVLRYGRRMLNGLAYELSYDEMVEKLTELTTMPLYKKEDDSWDTLAKAFPKRVGRKGLKLYYKDPELDSLIMTYVMKNGTSVVADWNPSMPRYVVPIQNKSGDGKSPVYRYTTSVSEIHPHLLLDDIYLEGLKHFEGHTLHHRALIPLSELLAKNA